MSGDRVNTFYVLPWLRLNTNLAFGTVEVGPPMAAYQEKTPGLRRSRGPWAGM